MPPKHSQGNASVVARWDIVSDKECKMYDPDFLNLKGGPAKTNQNRQVPGVRKTRKLAGAKVSQ